ncbi:RsmD family RNA methyltransferase [Flavitalea sp.]|nr:RsmD family RNA methyltransferase [Flavitalea sp.]
MRIIGGDIGGRRISPPANMPHTRPTTDVAKEGLFNVIENNLDISSLKVLDIFGGTGSISYEMASRGCMDITTVEKDQAMFEFIRKTATQLSLSQIKVTRMDVFKFLELCTEKFDFIFAGPPYALATIDNLPLIVFDKQLLKPGGWFVLEHTPRNEYEKSPHFSTSRKYGTTIFTIFVNRQG